MKKIVIILLPLVLALSLFLDIVGAAEENIRSVTVWSEDIRSEAIVPGEIRLYEYYAEETLPQIFIETENGIAPDDVSLVDPDRRAGTMSHLPVYLYVNADVTVRCCEGYEFENAKARVKIRGNYTSSVPKHPLRLKFDEKQAMCGLNEGHKMKSWVLLSEYTDASLLRNSAALYIANSLYSTTGNYASDFRNVEVYINGEYYGVYLLAEQQQTGRYRVNIPEPEDPAGDGRALLIQKTEAVRYEAGKNTDNNETPMAQEEDPADDGQALPAQEAVRYEAGKSTDDIETSMIQEDNPADDGQALPAQEAMHYEAGKSTDDIETLLTQEAAVWKTVHTGYLIEYDGYYFNEEPSETFSIRYDPVVWPDGQIFLPTSTGNGRKENGEDTRRGPGGIGGTGIGDTRETGFTIKSDIYCEEQNAFIKNTMQTIWDVLYDAVYNDHSDLAAHPYHTMDGDGKNITDNSIATAYEAVSRVVDIDSLIDMAIIQELAQDSDLDWSSRFFSIDMSSEGNHLLTYTAPWDFDNAFPIDSAVDRVFIMNSGNPWFVLFNGQDWFWERLNERWDEAMAAGVFSGVLEMLDILTAVNKDAYDRNQERWAGNSRGNSPGSASGQTAVSQAEAEESLRSWLEVKIRAFDRLLDERAGGETGSRKAGDETGSMAAENEAGSRKAGDETGSRKAGDETGSMTAENETGSMAAEDNNGNAGTE